MRGDRYSVAPFCVSDSMVVAAPVADVLFDGFGLEVLGEGLADQSGEFGVGGEAEGDELAHGELVDVRTFFGREDCLEAKAFFNADDAVLDDEGAITQPNGHHQEDERHDDGPHEHVPVFGPVMDGDVDGEDDVEGKHGEDEEVIGGIVADMVLEVLRSGHWNPLGTGCAGPPQHTILWVRLERW